MSTVLIVDDNPSARETLVAMLEAGMDAAQVAIALSLVDARGLVHAGRTDLDATKRDLAVPPVADAPADLPAIVEVLRPTILVGTTHSSNCSGVT